MFIHQKKAKALFYPQKDNRKHNLTFIIQSQLKRLLLI